MIMLSKEQILLLHQHLIAEIKELSATILKLASGSIQAQDLFLWILSHQF